SHARTALTGVETIIIDEIHSLVPTKRGAHLAISIERLAARCLKPPQRIGLSATQRPLDEVARFLGGAEGRARATKTGAKPGRPTGRPLPEHASIAVATHEISDEFSSHARIVRYRPVTI